MPEGDEAPAVVPNDGFPKPYRYVGDEKYRKALVSLRRAEYRFCSFVAATADDGAEIEGEIYGPKDHCPVIA
jgi:hypothetical protein